MAHLKLRESEAVLPTTPDKIGATLLTLLTETTEDQQSLSVTLQRINVMVFEELNQLYLDPKNTTRASSPPTLSDSVEEFTCSDGSWKMVLSAESRVGL